MRSSTAVFMEAVVVGVLTSALYHSLVYLDTGLTTPWLLFITGALIHIIFELAGLNEWWCRQTYKI